MSREKRSKSVLGYPYVGISAQSHMTEVAESPEIAVSLITPRRVRTQRRRGSTKAGVFSSTSEVERALSESRMPGMGTSDSTIPPEEAGHG